MAKVLGRDVKIGFGKETSRGTSVDPSFWLPLISFSYDDKKEEVIKEEAFGVIEDSIGSVVVSKWAEGELRAYLKDKAIGLLLLATLGQVSTENDTPEAGVYTHTFSVGQNHQHPSLTIARKIGTIEQLKFPLAMVNSLEIVGEVGKIVEVGVNFISKVGESASLTPAYSLENDFVSKHITIKFADNLSGLDGASAIEAKRFLLRVNKNLEKDDVFGSVEPKDILNKTLSIEAEVELLLQDTNFRDWAVGTSYKAMRIEIENDDVTIGSSTHPKLRIDLARVRPVDYARDFGLEDFVKETLSLKGFYSFDDGKAIEAVLINEQASY